MSDYANYSFLVLWQFVTNYIIQLHSTTQSTKQTIRDTLPPTNSSNGAVIAVPVIAMLFVTVLLVVGVILWKRKGEKGNVSKLTTAEFRVTAFKMCWSSVMDIWIVTSDWLHNIVQADFNSPRVQGLKNVHSHILVLWFTCVSCEPWISKGGRGLSILWIMRVTCTCILWKYVY